MKVQGMTVKGNNSYSKVTIFIWAALLLGGFAFMLYRNTYEGLWFDEALTAAYSNHSLSEIFNMLKWDSHPPLYYFMLRLFRVIFGNSVFALRAFSAVAVVALASLGAGPIRRILGKKTGIIYTFLVFTTPILLVYGQEVRMYTWAAYFVTGCILYGYLAAMEGRRKDWIRFAFFSLASMYTHFYGMLAVVMTFSIIFIWLIYRKKKEVVVKFMIFSGIIILCYLPWLINLIKLTLNGVGVSWIPDINFNIIVSTFSYPYGNKFGPPDPTLAFPIFIWLFVISLWGVKTSISKGRQEVKLVILALSVYLLTILSGITASYLFRPALVPRYMLPVIGLFLLPIAYTFGKLLKSSMIISLLILVLVCMPQILDIEQNQYNGPMKEVYSYINISLEEEDVFIHTNMHTMGTFWYYFPNNNHFLYSSEIHDNYNDFLFAPNVVKGSSMKEFLKDNKKNIWLITNTNSLEAKLTNSWINEGRFIITNNTRNFQLPKSWFAISVSKAKVGDESLID